MECIGVYICFGIRTIFMRPLVELTTIVVVVMVVLLSLFMARKKIMGVMRGTY